MRPSAPRRCPGNRALAGALEGVRFDLPVLASLACGALLILACLPRGAIRNSYGAYDRAIV